MLTKTITKKIEQYNKYQSKADDLRHEIETYLDTKYGIYEDNRYFTDGDMHMPYSIDGKCPIYDWGTRYFDTNMINEIITFINDFTNRTGERPDLFEIEEHFTRK